MGLTIPKRLVDLIEPCGAAAVVHVLLQPLQAPLRQVRHLQSTRQPSQLVAGKALQSAPL